MKQYLLILNMLIFVISVLNAQIANNPIGGKPASGTQSNVLDFDYQVKYQRFVFTEVQKNFGISHGKCRISS